MEITKCPECGSEVDDKAIVCLGCGAPQYYNQPPERKSKLNRGMVASFILGGIFIIIAITQIWWGDEPTATAFIVIGLFFVGFGLLSSKKRGGDK